MKKSNIWQRLVLFFAVICMLMVWPLCVVRKGATETIENEKYLTSDVMEPGTVLTQSFVATEGVFCGLEFVMDFDPELPKEGIFKIEILDEKDAVLYEGLFPYFLVEDYTFYRIDIDDMRLKKGATYKYRLTNQDVSSNLPGIVYTVKEQADGVEYRKLVFDDVEIEGESFVRYVWKEPLDLLSILGIWSCVGIGAALVWECLGQFRNCRKKLENKNQE